MNTQVSFKKCSENVKINYCTHCDYKSTRKCNVKLHIQRMHSTILKQEFGARVHTPFTELGGMNVKYEVKDPELLEDSIEVLTVYKLLQRKKNK